jgi:hypothetical protein
LEEGFFQGTTLREISLLKKIPPHINVIQLLDILFYEYQNGSFFSIILFFCLETLVLVFDFMKSDLYNFLHIQKKKLDPLAV